MDTSPGVPQQITGIPPLGQIGEQDHAAVTTLLTLLATEASEARDHWVVQADRNIEIYTYGCPAAEFDPDRVQVSDIQNAIIAAVDIQTREAPTATLEPRETGDQPQVFYVGPQQFAAQFGIPMEYVVAWPDPQTGAPQPPMAMDNDSSQRLQQMGLPEEYFIEVDERLAAEVAQEVFDRQWQLAGTDEWIREHVLDNSVQGWAWGMYEFDADRKQHIIRHFSVRQVYIDPTVRDIRDAAYAGIDWALDESEAAKLYPQFADEIHESADTGIPYKPDNFTQFGAAFNRTFYRPMVTLRVFWLRNQAVPLTPEDALGQGILEARMVQDETTGLQLPDGSAGPDGGALSDNNGADAGGDRDRSSDVSAMGSVGGNLPDGRADSGQSAEPTNEISQGVDNGQPEHDQDEERENNPTARRGDAGDEQAAGNGDAGASEGPQAESGGAEAPADSTPPQSGGPGLPAVHQRLGLFHPGGNLELTPDHPMWPCRYVIRQITQVGPVIVDDRQCEHWDIPLVLNVNIPIPQKPFGLGEPFRLVSKQKARADLLDSAVANGRFYRAPVIGISMDAYNSLPEEIRDSGYLDAETMIVWPNDQWQMLMANGGKPFAVQDPPQIPPSLMELNQQLKTEITEDSGHAEVLQGKAQPQIKSGKAIELLQSAASSSIGFKSQRLGAVIERIARLFHHANVNFLQLGDVAQIVRAYPPHVLAAIWGLVQRIEWNVNVVVAAGSGTVLQQKRQEAIQFNQIRDPVTMQPAMTLQTLQEELNIDVQQEKRRWDAERREAMQAQMMQMAQQARMQPQPQPTANNQPAQATQ